MRAVEAQSLEEGPEDRDDRLQRVRNSVRQTGGRAEAGQVEGYHLALGGQDPRHRVPGLVVVADAVEQDQRLSRTRPFVLHRDRTGAVRRIDGEGDRGGHGAAPWSG